MDNTALILVIVVLFLLVVLIGLLSVIVFKLLHNQNQTQTNLTPVATVIGEAPHPDVSRTEFHPEIVKRLKEIEKIKIKRPDLFCPNHSEEPGEVTCAICERFFCVACIKPYKTLHFCKEHIPLVMRFDWEEVLTIKTSTHDPEGGVRLYAAKKKLFDEKDIPTYVETHYKINVDQDYIETYLVVFSIPKDSAAVKENLQDA